jgi:hypothetical protein
MPKERDVSPNEYRNESPSQPTFGGMTSGKLPDGSPSSVMNLDPGTSIASEFMLSSRKEENLYYMSPKNNQA